VRIPGITQTQGTTGTATTMVLSIGVMESSSEGGSVPQARMPSGATVGGLPKSQSSGFHCLPRSHRPMRPGTLIHELPRVCIPGNLCSSTRLHRVPSVFGIQPCLGRVSKTLTEKRGEVSRESIVQVLAVMVAVATIVVVVVAVSAEITGHAPGS
jgi:hypothetical protein